VTRLKQPKMTLQRVKSKMSTKPAVTGKKQTFLAKVKEGAFKAVPFQDGHYFINKEGTVVSMNSDTPRQIFPMVRSDGAYVVLLYTPNVTKYEVAEIILLTFSKSSGKNKFICHKDNNRSHCELSNLYWGDENAYKKMKQSILKQQTARVLGSAQKQGYLLLDNVFNDSAEVQKNERSARMFKLTAALLSDISKILSELAQLAAQEVISKADNDYLLRVTKTLYDITNQPEVEAQTLIDLCLLVPKDDEFADIMSRYRDKFTRAGSRYE
jgi:hypothetical protein